LDGGSEVGQFIEHRESLPNPNSLLHQAIGIDLFLQGEIIFFALTHYRKKKHFKYTSVALL